MKKYLFIGGTVAALVALVLMFNPGLQAKGQVVVDKPAIDFTLSDISGKKVSLSDYKGKYVVLEWVNYDCPFVRKHYDSGNMQALQKKYMDKGVVWLAVCSSAPGKQGHFTTDETHRRMKQQKSTPTAYLLDPDGKIGRIYGATNTPHMYIVNPAGTLIYMGAIDDKPTTDLSDIATAKNYVQVALDAVMASKEVPVKATKAYGCTVKYP